LPTKKYSNHSKKGILYIEIFACFAGCPVFCFPPFPFSCLPFSVLPALNFKNLYAQMLSLSFAFFAVKKTVLPPFAFPALPIGSAVNGKSPAGRTGGAFLCLF